MSNRGSGILLHISSLPSKYGIGTLGRKAYDFVDLLADMGQKYWQVLPIGPTLYGDSPYQSPSAYAGNPYFIDLEFLEEEGIISYNDYAHIPFGEDPARVDYGALYHYRAPIFEKISDNFCGYEDETYKKFYVDSSYWLDDYALFMALKESAGGREWGSFDTDIKKRNCDALSRASERLKSSISKHKILQFLFFKQWNSLKHYANSKGIKIIGDIPIYVAYDSSDVWSHPWLFELDKEHFPVRVAGCPPDSFSSLGQRWGNPVYNWKEQHSELFSWWRKRLLHSMKLYDMIRIDHFRGFSNYYAIPASEATAVNGTWEQGPGYELFEYLKNSIGELPIIAEDLGFLNDDVRRLLKDCGFPGMKVMQFAFDSREDNDYLPHNYSENCVVYTGTHDNDTLIGWLNSAPYEYVEYAKKYMGLPDDATYETISDAFVRNALASVGNTVIIPMQDILKQGGYARMNMPSTPVGNWRYRLTENDMNSIEKDRLREWTFIYGRG